MMSKAFEKLQKLDIILCPVSLFAVEEYEALQENLDLERDLRAEAENFAREVIFLSAPIIGLGTLDR